MPVRNATYEKVVLERNSALRQAQEILETHNKLVNRINKLGGDTLLTNAKLGVEPQFTKEELNKLVGLCHPDKHGGIKAAHDMTSKLLKMRGL